MKLTLKMSIFLMIGILIIMVIDGYITIQREVNQFENNMRHRAILLGNAIKKPFLDSWVISGRKKALALIQDVNRGEDQLTIRWVWLNKWSSDGLQPEIDVKTLKFEESEGNLFFKRQDPKTERTYLACYIPVKTPSGEKGWIELIEDMKDMQFYTWEAIKKTSIIIGLTILLCSLFILFIGFFVIGQRLDKLKLKAERIGEGDMDGPVQIAGNDELSDLGDTINQMCVNLKSAIDERNRETEARLIAIDQLHHADRLKTIGTLASGIAHEIGTPINVVSGRAGLIISGELSGEAVRNNAEIIKDQANRITALIKQLLDFARIEPSPKKRVDLRKITLQTVDLMKPMLKKSQIELAVREPEKALMVTVDVVKMQQVISNLISNAQQAMTVGGKIEIELDQITQPKDKSGDYILLLIRDHGTGIPEDIMPNVFDPFFSTKESGKGTGLGLSIVQSIVREHGGWIDVQSEPGQGACFQVFLPKEGNNER